MRIEIKADKGARILDSDCPAKICVHTGWIRMPGETIVCLPNKILLEIQGTKEEYDASPTNNLEANTKASVEKIAALVSIACVLQISESLIPQPIPASG